MFGEVAGETWRRWRVLSLLREAGCCNSYTRYFEYVGTSSMYVGLCAAIRRETLALKRGQSSRGILLINTEDDKLVDKMTVLHGELDKSAILQLSLIRDGRRSVRSSSGGKCGRTVNGRHGCLSLTGQDVLLPMMYGGVSR